MGTWYVLLQRWHLEVAVVLGFLLDLLLGDPEHWFHPVRLIGGLVRELERRLYPKAGPPVAAFWNGLFLWLCCVGAVGGSVYLLTGVLRRALPLKSCSRTSFSRRAAFRTARRRWRVP